MNRANLVRFAACSLVFPATTLLSAAPAPPAPAVHISTGTLRGSLQGNIAVFKGIPFAAPPVGELRWRPPQPAARWKGERDATHPGSACVQSVDGLGPFIQPLAAAYGASYTIQPVTFSEDCLFLNVWVPGWPATQPQPAHSIPVSARPVMVWLHGGSNTAGSGSQATYDAASLAAHGVIVVTINYRLGVFGFFSLPALTAESPHHSSGQYGLLDQIAALQWVQANIAAFGGDPANVTVFGESAGSIDAGVLITSPLAANLFRRVILESGPPFGLGPTQTLAQAEAAGQAIANAAPKTAPTPLESLRKMSAADLYKLANAHGPYAASGPVDGWIIPQPPAKAFLSGAAQKVDILVGINGRELSAFRLMAAAAAAKSKSNPQPAASPGAGALQQLFSSARPLYGGWSYAAVAAYLGQAVVHRDAAIDQGANDILLACPVGALATLTSAADPHIFVYRFNRSIPGKGQAALGAFHGLEVPFVFNAFQERSWSWLPFTDADHQLSATIETYWTNFAKTGDPNGPGVPPWPAWRNGSEDYMELSPQAAAVASRGFSPPFCYLAPQRVRQSLDAAK
jgi:para-nitrobenzyl esterase